MVANCDDMTVRTTQMRIAGSQREREIERLIERFLKLSPAAGESCKNLYELRANIENYHKVSIVTIESYRVSILPE